MMTPLESEILIHYSQEPLGKLYSTASQTTPRHYFEKPHGLWVSVKGEDGWKEWCESENFQWPKLRVENLIELKPGANILRLQSPEQMDEFTKQYGVVPTIFLDDPTIPMRSFAIDWPKVAGEYQGIIIAPYQWERRMAMFTSWYYGWDCASGCIWSVDAIQSVTSTVMETHESTLQTSND